MSINNLYDAFKERCGEFFDLSGASFGDDSNDPLAVEFIERIRLYALAVARRVIKGTDKRSDILDDAVQDATIQVLTKLHTFQGGAKFSVWAYTVVSNICKAAAKKGQCKIKTTRESEFGDGSEVTILDYITRDHRVKNDSYGWQSRNNSRVTESVPE
jgi:DNA-directed RNA polymerase specialized sigma24 family protein